MAQFSVNDQTRRVRAVVSGTNQQEFSVAFQSNATTDIQVFVDGTQKTEGTHYDIKATTGASAANGINTDGTCVVKFRYDAGAAIDHRPTQNQVVTIISDIALARSSVYTAGGNITAESLESDFDTITMQMAEREEAASRALTAPKFDPTDIDMTLPDKDARKGKGLAFNATTGNPEAADFVQTASEIRALVESASDSNVFTDADHSKLDGIEANATADQTASEIRSLVESASDSNVFTDADHTKLDGIESAATADQTAAEIRALVGSASDSNVFTDADHSKLDGIEASADVTDTTNVVAALTAGTNNVTIAADGTISADITGVIDAGTY